MGSVQTQRRVFRRGSNVLDYWLAHAEEFEVRSRSGTREWVEDVVVDPEAGHAETLILRSWPFRRRSLPAEAVKSIDPFERRLVIEDDASRQAPPVAPPVVAAIAQVPLAFVWLGLSLGRAASSLLADARALTPVVSSAVAWLRPRARGVAIATLTNAIAVAEATGRAVSRLSARVLEGLPR